MTRLAGIEKGTKADVQEPTVNAYGAEEHPAWGMISASRVQSTGTTLFDSDVNHHHYVTVRISTADRGRDLNHDWIHPRQQFVEVAMSEAQWASFVSSMNAGSGVPCTITWREGERIPDFPHEARLAESMKEVRDAAEKATEKIREAFAAYKEKKTVGNLRHLEAMIANAPSNMTFAAKSLTEHAENVVQRSRVDIEAMVLAKAKQIGLDPADLGVTLELGSGEGSER